MSSPYGYETSNQAPTESHAIAFAALYGASTVIHIGQAVWTREWWLLATVIIFGILEVLGWAGRAKSSTDPLNIDMYTMQIATLIIAPCFFTAMIYVLLGFVTQQQGPKYSTMPPKAFGITFIVNDVISIIIQAIGGGMASSAAHNGEDASTGGHIMLAGIIYQLVCVLVYAGFLVEFCVRYYQNNPVKNSRGEGIALNQDNKREQTKLALLLVMLSFTTILTILRGCYRVAELSDGWDGYIIQTEKYFDILDGFPMITAIAVSNILHPGFLKPSSLSNRKQQADELSKEELAK